MTKTSLGEISSPSEADDHHMSVCPDDCSQDHMLRLRPACLRLHVPLEVINLGEITREVIALALKAIKWQN